MLARFCILDLINATMKLVPHKIGHQGEHTGKKNVLGSTERTHANRREDEKTERWKWINNLSRNDLKKITSSVETKPQLKRHLYEAFEFSQRLLYYILSFCMLGSFCHQATSKLYLKPLPTWHSFFLFSMAYSRKVRSEEHGIFLIPDYNKDNIGAINIGLHVCLDVTIEYQPF